MGAQRYTEAVQLLRRSVQLTPNNWTAEYDLGLALDQIDNNAEAFVHYKNALTIDPSKEEAWMRVADIYNKSKDYRHAIPLYEQFLAKFPNSAKANEGHIQLGVAYVGQGRIKESWSEFNKGLAMKPDDTWGWHTAAWAYDSANKYEQAAYMYKQFIRRFPADRETAECKERIKALDYRLERGKIESQSASASDTLDDFVVVQNPVAAKTVAMVKRGLRTVPRAYQRELQEAGYKVLVCPTIVEAFPEMTREHPRGWSDDATWHNNNGVFKANIKTSVVAEKRLGLGGNSYIADDEIDKTAAHELGHAYDHFLGTYAKEQHFVDQYEWFSHGNEFSQAYNFDAAKIAPTYRKKLDYFLQPGTAGKEELFAQMFPLLYCGRPRPGSSDELFAQAFPHVLKVMSQSLSPVRLKNKDLYDSRIKTYPKTHEQTIQNIAK